MEQHVNNDPRNHIILKPVPEGRDPEWDVYIDGVLHRCRHAEVVLNRPGKPYRCMQFGLVESEGNSYPAIVYRETEGGGTVIIPMATVNGELFIGAAIQRRLCMGPKPVLNAVGGYMKPGASALEQGAEELAEEVGVSRLFGEMILLPGEPININRAFVDTSGEGEGVKFMGVPVHSAALEPLNDGTGCYRFRQDAVEQAPDVDPNNKEKVIGTVFVPVRVAIRLAEGFLSNGAARAQEYLRELYDIEIPKLPPLM